MLSITSNRIMDQELLEKIQNIKVFKVYKVWSVKSKTYHSRVYSSKGHILNAFEDYIGKKMYILICVNSITETTYEWI